MTLKTFLQLEHIQITSDDRMILGKRIAKIFDSQKQGEHIKIKENKYLVMDYTIRFLNQKCITKMITKWLKNHNQ